MPYKLLENEPTKSLEFCTIALLMRTVFQVPIPLTSKSVGDVLDFASSATKKLTDPLVDSSNQPKFNAKAKLPMAIQEM